MTYRLNHEALPSNTPEPRRYSFSAQNIAYCSGSLLSECLLQVLGNDQNKLSSSHLTTTSMTINGKCYCGAIHWKVVAAVDFTAVCHCRDCQCISGSAFGSTSLMIYGPKGVEFSGEIEPKVYHATSEAGRDTQRYVPSCALKFILVPAGE